MKAVPNIRVEVGDTEITFKPIKETKQSNALWGLARALLANAVRGVTEGYEKKLEIQGIGFRAEVRGNEMVLDLGFSHSVSFSIPEGIKAIVEKNIITISGIDRALVGEAASKIRALKKPEPYKGKGIRYVGEIVKIKAGKKAVGAGTAGGAA